MNEFLHGLKDYYWPFHQMFYTPDSFKELTESEKETYRLKNRWQLIHMKPYLLRWLITSVVFFVLVGVAGEVGHLVGGFVEFILFSIVWAGFLGSVCMMVFLAFVYSFRPK